MSALSASYQLPRIDIQAQNLKDECPQFGRELSDVSESFEEFLEAKARESQGAALQNGSLALIQKAAEVAFIALMIRWEGATNPDGSPRQRPVMWLELKEDVPNDHQGYLALVAKVKTVLESFDFARMDLRGLLAEVAPFARALIEEFKPQRKFVRFPFNGGPQTRIGGDGEEAQQH